ncbi:MAG: lysophospholipid acyltransferase family protein [Proteobacteria bacterium]|nr:lysophospholipid acyltransferase family protein [Pseudomonadota bacterium]
MRKILSFISLIVSTIVLSTVFIIVSLVDRRGEKIHRIRRLWAGLHLKVCGIHVSLKGLDNIKKPPYIIMCNHQSALDIYALLSSLPLPFKWIAKRQLFFIPFIGWVMKIAGDISLDRENPREALKAIEAAARKIREGTNIIIFPEGTRSKDGTLLPFKKGVFSLALRAGVPIVPVGIYGTSRLQPKGSFIPKEKGVIYINIGEAIHIVDKGRSAKTEVMNAVRAEIERLIETR